MSDLTDAELTALERENLPEEVPVCQVCGGKMEPKSDSVHDGRTYYICSGREGFRHTPGFVWRPSSDPRIPRLVAEVRRWRGEEQ